MQVSIISFKISALLDLSFSLAWLHQHTSFTLVEDQNMICIKPDDNKEDNKSIESESRNVEEETQSCGRLIELIDAQYNGEEDSECKTKNSVDEADTYMEQEKAVLETFRDWLKKFNNTIRFNS